VIRISCVFLVTKPLSFYHLTLTLEFDDHCHLFNWLRTGPFVFHKHIFSCKSGTMNLTIYCFTSFAYMETSQKLQTCITEIYELYRPLDMDHINKEMILCRNLSHIYNMHKYMTHISVNCTKM
jgi:hypothetical protein